MTTGSAASRSRRLKVPSAVTGVAFLCWLPLGGMASAATIGPPLLDITHECDAIARRNVSAMSECIVAESEARAEILQKWSKYSDPIADKCVKLGRKSRKYSYGVMAKCFAGEPAATRMVKSATGR